MINSMWLPFGGQLVVDWLMTAICSKAATCESKLIISGSQQITRPCGSFHVQLVQTE